LKNNLKGKAMNAKIYDLEAIRAIYRNKGFDATWVELNVKDIKLDVGCGKRCINQHIGIDKIAEDADICVDIGRDFLPFESGTVKEIYTSHTLEHLTGSEVKWFMNEAWRVLENDGRLIITVPHYKSRVAFQDLDHKSFFTEATFKYFNRSSNPHQHYTITDINCDFQIIRNDTVQDPDKEHTMLYVELSAYKPLGCIVPSLGSLQMIEDVIKSEKADRELSDKESEDLKKAMMIFNREEPVEKDEYRLQHILNHFPGIDRVACECAEVRLEHGRLYSNRLGEEGFATEFNNMHRKFNRLEGMCLKGHPTEVWRIRKNLFDMINYGIAALEAFDKEVEETGCVTLPQKVKAGMTVEEMKSAAKSDSVS
jgi:predicted SAM-dependent methyltransferase